MTLPDYPTPKLDTTLHEVDRVLGLLLQPSDHKRYHQEMEAVRPTIEAHHSRFEAAARGHENWATDGFRNHMLSLRGPLPLTTSMAALLQPSEQHQDQLEYAAVLLWSMGQLETEMTGPGAQSSPLETTQQSELFGATRIPGEDADSIVIYRGARHAIVLHRDSAFPVRIRTELNEPLTAAQIFAQLRAVVRYEGERHAAVSHLTTRPRAEWARLRESLTKSAPDALQTLESAIAVLALEEGELAVGDEETVGTSYRALKTERMRHYDKVLNVVVHRNCVAGLLVDHATVDGLVAAILAQRMYALAEQQQRPTVAETCVDASASVQPLDFGAFQFPPSLPDQSVLTPFDVDVLDFTTFPDALTTLHEERLYDAWISLSLQMAVEATFGTDAASRFLLVSPTHMRHFKRGRCDPTYAASKESRHLVSTLLRGSAGDSNSDEQWRLLDLCAQAVAKHVQLVQLTKAGLGIGPYVGHLRNTLSESGLSELASYLQPFGAPSVCLTGSSKLDRIACGVGNIYVDQQLVVAYMGRKGSCRIAMTASGMFHDHMATLKQNLGRSLGTIFQLFCQLGILKQMNVKRPLPEISSQKNVAMVIHGGAADHLDLGKDTMDMVRFALYCALVVGVQKLASGHSSLDAVEAAVSAMENCPLFNAAKGAVYNEEGQHELDACIIDGATGSVGAITCVTTVRNPVQGARKVMENCDHVCLAGTAADEFCHKQGLPTVDNHHFDTDVRFQQFKMAVAGGGTAKNHRQTVGAVAIDARGRLAAATSTGGLVGKMRGRVGDTAVVGAGVYADGRVAVACTGEGEAFLRKAIAARVAVTRALQSQSTLDRICRNIIDEDMSGHVAGIVAVDDRLQVTTTSNAPMFSATYHNGQIEVHVADRYGHLNGNTGDNPTLQHGDVKAPLPSKVALVRPPCSWKDPQHHSRVVLTNRWYSNLFQIQDTLYHATVDFFHNQCGYGFAMTPITTDTISSPMGLGSDSEPVHIDLLGQPTFLADSMQFALEYFLRLHDGYAGTYYVSPSFRGEIPDAEHLNQFYHVECELLGGLDDAIAIAESYVRHLTKRMLTERRDQVFEMTGTVAHLEKMLHQLGGERQVPRISLDSAVELLGDDGGYHELVDASRPECGTKLTRKGERALMRHFGGPVWLTDMDHMSVPFYQAYVHGSNSTKAKAADFLFGMGETVGLGERHQTAEQVIEALAQHDVPESSYSWYVDMRRIKSMLTSGWGMGTERYLCWLLQHDDVRDIQIVPRLKGMKFLP